MSIEGDLTTVMTNDASLNALVSGRNYKGTIVQNSVLPYTFTQRVDTLPLQHLTGTSGTINARYQIDCYADSYANVWILARAVRSALESATLFKARWLDDIDGNFEEDMTSYRVISDYSIWWNE